SGTFMIRSGNFDADATQEHTGTFSVAEGATLRFHSGRHQLAAGSRVEGSGTFAHTGGTLINHATFSPGAPTGILAYSGNFAAASDDAGILIDLAGEAPGTGYDQLRVTGSATLAGRLEIDVSSGFTPGEDEAFTVMRFASRTGTFDEVVWPSGAGGSVAYTDTTVVVTPGASAGALPVTDDLATTPQAAPVAINVLVNDVGPDDLPLSIDSFTEGEHGSVAQEGDSTLVYTPNGDFVGTDAFTYTVSNGTTTGEGTVTVYVYSADGLPSDARTL